VLVQQLKSTFRTLFDDLGSEYFNDTRLSNILNQATLAVLLPFVKNAGENGIIDSELQPLITKKNVLFAVNYAPLPNDHWRELEINVSYDGTNYLTAIMGDFQKIVSRFDNPKARQPRYWLIDGTVEVRPAKTDGTAFLGNLKYIKYPLTIDLVNNPTADNGLSTDISARIIDLTVQLAKESAREIAAQ